MNINLALFKCKYLKRIYFNSNINYKIVIEELNALNLKSNKFREIEYGYINSA